MKNKVHIAKFQSKSGNIRICADKLIEMLLFIHIQNTANSIRSTLEILGLTKQIIRVVTIERRLAGKQKIAKY